MATDERRLSTRSRANPGGMDVLSVLGPDVRPMRERKPPWFKVQAPGGERYRELTKLIADENLHTVCQEAACPNVGECWERGTATFMIHGDTCTRRCGFCNVKTGRPTWNDPLEPARVARTIARMGLRHAVITSVDRDDLPDKGARIWAATIRQIRRQAPGCKVEVLTPDFQGQEMPLATVLAERPDVFNHNVEVVPRLYPIARRGSTFRRSCRVLRNAKAMGLRHAVVTSVDRDDLPDYGASAFVGVIRSIRMLAPGCKVEILTPDFRGQEMPLAKVIHERPDVFNHNVETVPRLYSKARRGSQFMRSTRVLRLAKEMGGEDVVTKSGLMVGLGESFEEMVDTFGILRDHGVQVLTVGQYLRPTENHLPVDRYWHPEEFEAMERAAYELGFESVASGPLVRSSYHADQNLPSRAVAG
jgi:lipoate synthase